MLRDGQLVRTVARAETTPREITHLMVGREIEETDLRQPRTPGDVVLEVRGLSLPWPGHARQLAAPRRQLHAPPRRDPGAGRPDGRGPHRAAGMPLRLPARSRRRARSCLEGRPVRFRHPAEAMRAGIALVTEDRKRLGIFANLDVGRNISSARCDEATRLGLAQLPAGAGHGAAARPSSWA